MVGKVSTGIGRYLSYFGKMLEGTERYLEVPFLFWYGSHLFWYFLVPLGTPFVSIVRFLGMDDSH